MASGTHAPARLLSDRLRTLLVHRKLPGMIGMIRQRFQPRQCVVYLLYWHASAARILYTRRANYSTTKSVFLRCFITRSTRREMWNSSSSVIRKPTIASNTSLCELKIT